MGGSTLGSDLVRTVFASSLKIPFSIVNGYSLPACVDRHTLLILSSYSGSTEETLAAGREGLKRHARITGLTTGGSLARFFERNTLPWYRIVPTENPAGQPRMGLGYNAMGQLGLLAALGVLKISQADIREVLSVVGRRTASCSADVPTAINPAKQLSKQLAERLPILVGFEHLVGSMHAFANQINETGKAYAVPFALPELNHHLLEGLRFPKAVRTAVLVTANSSFVHPRIAARQRITRQIVRRLGMNSAEIRLRGRSRLAEAFDLLAIAGAASLYLSVLHRVDPLKITTVDELKRRLSRV
jgi:glucose/mannose-6-phosphate isomerase